MSVISCGTNNTYGHPLQSVLDDLLAIGDVFLTEIGVSDRDYTGTVIASGDITLVSADDGKTFTVTVPDGTKFTYTAKGAEIPVCSV